MAAPTPDSPVRLHLKVSDTEAFIERFAPNVTRGGIFLQSRDLRDVGASIRFELVLQDAEVVFAGQGVVTWVKPQGMGVKFTTLDPASEPILERLLSRRQSTQGAKVPAAAEPKAHAEPEAAAEPKAAAKPKAAAEPEAAAKPEAAAEPEAADVSFPTALGPARTLTPLPSALTPLPSTLTPLPSMTVSASVSEASPQPGRTRSPVGRVLAWSIGLGSLAVIGMWVGRARLGPGPAPEPRPVVAAPATPIVEETPPPVQVAAPAPPTAVEPPKEADPPPVVPEPASAAAPSESAAAAPATGGRTGSLRVESLLVGPSYARFTCPRPTSRFSVRSHKMVNACLEVEHRPGKTEHLTFVWEKDGRFSGKTRVEIAATRPNIRTRAHMKLGRNRVGSWSVRVVTDRKVTLAETTFAVVP